MSYAKTIALVLFALLLLFVGHILLSTGFFRSIESKFDGTVFKKVAIKGAEDITISVSDGFALISATDRNTSALDGGGLFLMDLNTIELKPILLTGSFSQHFAPHGIAVFKKNNVYHVMAVNHTRDGHTIEVFELVDKNMTHIRTLSHPTMVQPNDLVMIDENKFYFTNDHKYTKGLGLIAEEYLGLALSNVIYFDGENYSEVANDIAYANGINFDRKRNLLYVASPRDFLVRVFSRNTDGALTFIEDIPCGTGVDNIELDEHGKLWIGAHPNLLRFNAYMNGTVETTPSEIITIDYKGKGDYFIEKVFIDDGSQMSGSTVAAVYNDLIFTGNVTDDTFLILKRAPQPMEPASTR